MNIAVMSAMTKQDSRDEPRQDGENHSGGAMPAGEPQSSQLESADTSAGDMGWAKPPSKPRTRKPRPTYEDGALTRIFKFPSKAYPRSTYYVTGDEIIIRIKKARKKWKLVIPKKRIVSYKTNRWFAKPRWIELELTVTQATRLGLVEPRGSSSAVSATALSVATLADQVSSNEAGIATEDADTGLDATDAASSDAGPEVSLIEETEDGADAEATGLDDGLDTISVEDANACVSPDDSTAAIAADEDDAKRAVLAGTSEIEPSGEGAGSSPLVTGPCDGPGPADQSPPVPAHREPILFHVARAEETGAADSVAAAVHAAEVPGSAPTFTVTMLDRPQPADDGAVLTIPVLPDPAGRVVPVVAMREASKDVPGKPPSRRVVFSVMAVVLLMASSVATWVMRDGGMTTERIAGAVGEIGQRTATPVLIETGSIIRSDARRVDEPAARELARIDVPATPAMAETAAPPAPVTRPDVPEGDIEPMERVPEWTTLAAAIEPAIQVRPEVQPEQRSAREAPRAPELVELSLPSMPPLAIQPPPIPSTVKPGICEEMEAAARSMRVQFGYASASLDVAATSLLDAFAGRLLACGTGRVIIEGHADPDGDADRNQALSVRRAQAVWRHLVKAGASPERLSVVGYGHSRPDAPNVTPEDKHRNRRAILVVDTPR